MPKLENGNTIVTDSKNGKESILKYNVLKEENNLSLVNIELITGSRYDPPKGSLNYYICKGIDGLYILFGMMILLWMVVDYIRMYLFM